MIKTLKLSSLLVVAICLASCKNDDDSGCDENLICTTQFVTIQVYVKNQNQSPVALDAFEVIDFANDNDVTITLSATEFQNAQQSGIYPLVNDHSFDKNQERQVRFKGFINNQEVISSTYTVGTDCCHISLVSGNPDLTL